MTAALEVAPRPAPDKYVRTTFQRRLGLREAAGHVLPADQLTTQEERETQYDRLEGMIGNTPLLGLRAPNGSWVLAKAEFQNPTESHYDRVYVKTLRELEKRGVIKPGDDLFEVTSGSAGISFAWACSRLGYKAHIFVPQGTPIGRNQEMVNFGAELIETETEDIPSTSKMEQRQYIRFARTRGLRPAVLETDDEMFHLWSAPGAEGKPGAHMINHSENHFTHYAMEAVGDEIAAVIPDGESVDYFVSVLGNGTNTRGIKDGLDRHFEGVKTIGVESRSNPVQFETKYPGRYAEMFGADPTYERQEMKGSSQRGTKLSFLDVETLADIQLVEDDEWGEQMAQYNDRRPPVETIGRTSSAGLVVAKRVDVVDPGSVILTVFYDKADRYNDLVTGVDLVVSLDHEHPEIPRRFTQTEHKMQPFGVRRTRDEEAELIRTSLGEEVASISLPGRKQAKVATLQDLPYTLAAANSRLAGAYDAMAHPERRDI